ncbi:MAG: glycine cleavage system aminomethyltransferase GcvT [Deltaproteobacteria bacterium]|nr:MAG: glycine cleavage system aminomethyltransferase GcvT [Deltaproteobacteria bacterium]
MTSATRRLPLHDRHIALGARLAPFAGYEMPLRYGSTVEEHHATRTGAGLFDVSHMGEVFLRGPGALAALQQLVTNDVARLEDGQALYTVMCSPEGGIIDDLIVYRLADDDWLLCVNAANRDEDVAWIREVVGDAATVADESDEWAQLALQGPLARTIALPLLAPDLEDLPTFGVARARLGDHALLVARTGYTGEDGFEFYIPAAAAEPVLDRLLEAGEAHGITPVGLAARDTLRLEARLLLHGNDISRETNPVEAGLSWVVRMDKGPFIGRDALERIREDGVSRRLRGFVLEERGMLRAGYPLFKGDEQVGSLTSGGIAPSLDGASIGLGYVRVDVASEERLDVEIRGRRLPVAVTRKPFYRRDA